MFITKAMGLTNGMAMSGKELKEAISNVNPKILDGAAFKNGMKDSNPNCTDEIEELFSGVRESVTNS